MELKPYQERVIEEKQQLDQKLEKLKTFIDANTAFAALEADEQERLRRQHGAMCEYSVVLQERIAVFS